VFFFLDKSSFDKKIKYTRIFSIHTFIHVFNHQINKWHELCASTMLVLRRELNPCPREVYSLTKYTYWSGAFAKCTIHMKCAKNWNGVHFSHFPSSEPSITKKEKSRNQWVNSTLGSKRRKQKQALALIHQFPILPLSTYL
jgi:hypothetical protein